MIAEFKDSTRIILRKARKEESEKKSSTKINSLDSGIPGIPETRKTLKFEV